MIFHLAEVGVTESVGIQIVKAFAIFALFLSIAPVVILVERKLMGRMQSRYGPNRVGP